MKFIRPTDPIAMDRLVTSLRGTQPTYADVGASLAGIEPQGFRHDRYEILLGRGTESFQRAVTGLRSWKAHAGPGVRVFPHEEVIIAGVTVVVTLGTPFLALAAPCRIVGVVDEQAKWGFAYGTLPGHPEKGEEAFVVSISPDETVHFEIVAFSRPADPLTRLSASRVLSAEASRRGVRTATFGRSGDSSVGRPRGKGSPEAQGGVDT